MPVIYPIDKVFITKLEPRLDDRGYLMEVLRRSDYHFASFGQVYLTTAYPGIVKAWHCHEKQTDQLCCIIGHIKLVLWHPKGEGGKPALMEIHMGETCPKLVTIPPGVWHGFTPLGIEKATVMNIASETYNMSGPDELRKPWNSGEIGYDWEVRSG